MKIKDVQSEIKEIAANLLIKGVSDDIDKTHKQVRKLYEKLTIIKHLKEKEPQEKSKSNSSKTKSNKKEIFKEKKDVKKEIKPEPSDTKILPTETIPEKIEEKIIKSKTEEEIEDKNTLNEEILNTSEPITSIKEEVQELEQTSIEQSFEEHFIPDDLFVREEKKEILEENKKRTLHDKLMGKQIKIDLNDRIAFVKQLFNGQQEDFNRILSQLNTFETENETISFLHQMVVPEYKWNIEEDDVYHRFEEIIKRKFL